MHAGQYREVSSYPGSPAELVYRLVHPAVFDTIREPLLILDASLSVLAANPAFYRTFDEAPKTVIGRGVFDLGDRQWDIPELRSLLESVLPLQRKFESFEIDHDFPSIGRHVFHLNAREIVPEETSPRVILLAFEDVTQRIWLTRRSDEAAAELQRSNSDLAQFSNMAAHDMQAPLNKIASFLDLATHSAGDRLTDKEKGFIETAKTQTDRMSMLLQDLLVFGKLASGSHPLEDVDIGRIVSDVEENLHEEIQIAGGEFEIGPLPVIKGKRFQIRQLVRNLIENSLKYRRKDVTPKIRISADTGSDGRVDLSVQDNGIGFSADQAEIIFEPFRRLHGSGSGYKGTGMGLAICRRVMEGHSGSIRGEGSPDRGARFVASFPAGSASNKKKKP